MMPVLPTEVARCFLTAVDERAPGLVTGMYLHGSPVYGDYWPDRSDVDFVSVLSRRAEEDEIAALRAAHEVLGGRFPGPYFDGIHLTAQDLAAGPDECPDSPGILESVFEPASRVALCPVTWHELIDGGIRVRGPELTELAIWEDTDALVAYSRANLTSYWTPRLEQLRAAPAEAAAGECAVQWFVLGISRLHHLLATRRLTSKSGAGRYALGAFGARWHPIVWEALRLRTKNETPARTAQEVAADNRAFSAMAIESALAL